MWPLTWGKSTEGPFTPVRVVRIQHCLQFWLSKTVHTFLKVHVRNIPKFNGFYWSINDTPCPPSCVTHFSPIQTKNRVWPLLRWEKIKKCGKQQWRLRARAEGGRGGRVGPADISNQITATLLWTLSSVEVYTCRLQYNSVLEKLQVKPDGNSLYYSVSPLYVYKTCSCTRNTPEC